MLLYLMKFSKLDLSNFMKEVSKNLDNPTEQKRSFEGN